MIPTLQLGQFGMSQAGLGTDAKFSSVVLLLHGEGVDGGGAFTDSSSKARSIAASSNTTTSTAQKKYGTLSIAFANVPDTTGIRWADSADFTLGTGDFAFECWIRFADTGTLRWFLGQTDTSGAVANSSISMSRTAANKIRAAAGDGTGTLIADITSSSSVTSGQWYFVHFGRVGTTFRLAIDGVSEGTATSSNSVKDSTYRLAIGALGEYVTNSMYGWMDEVRYTVGVSRDYAAVPSGEFPNL